MCVFCMTLSLLFLYAYTYVRIFFVYFFGCLYVCYTKKHLSIISISRSTQPLSKTIHNDWIIINPNENTLNYDSISLFLYNIEKTQTTPHRGTTVRKAGGKLTAREESRTPTDKHQMLLAKVTLKGHCSR